MFAAYKCVNKSFMIYYFSENVKLLLEIIIFTYTCDCRKNFALFTKLCLVYFIKCKSE